MKDKLNFNRQYLPLTCQPTSAPYIRGCICVKADLRDLSVHKHIQICATGLTLVYPTVGELGVPLKICIHMRNHNNLSMAACHQ